ncbi:DUF4232 domain-containing protein [Streptomyces sp. TLI_146]|uniref:DUF4232 domain-containing protein n=1 Tax=Streptomyces sp. TLI_146 TaxID=1938858 RepID=UPI000C706C91|nr:DUF4232 domain-containing protein [Streptomyces sp. TLI_146]PKV89431.1 uncharacterized protein DUF4232 [Streptomyces sp. TLI_146]
MPRPRFRWSAVAVVAAGLTLGGCGGDHSEAAATSSAPSASASGSVVDGSGSPSPSPTPSGPGAAASGGRCRTADLGFAIVPTSRAKNPNLQYALTVTLTNKGAKSCVMTGYPGVDLVGPLTWSLARQTAVQPHRVTVRPGATTTFNIFYLPYVQGSGDEFKPTRIVVTPPGETHSHTLPWPVGSILLQDAATHPGTYVSPVGAK